MNPYILFALLSAGFGGGWYVNDLRHDSEELEAKEIQIKSSEKTVEVVTKYVDRVKVIHEKGETIIKEVPIYVSQKSDSSCVVPVGFGLLWDGSNRGEIPETAGDSNEVASSIVLSDVAAQHTRESTICRATEEQLIELQEWVRLVYK